MLSRMPVSYHPGKVAEYYLKEKVNLTELICEIILWKLFYWIQLTFHYIAQDAALGDAVNMTWWWNCRSVTVDSCYDWTTVTTGCGKKSYPLSYFSNFLAIVQIGWNCYFILCSYWHIAAKYCLIILKCDKVVWFQTWQPPSFDVVKNIEHTRTHNKLYK